MIGFCLRDRSAFILNDTGDISLVSLTQDTQQHAPERLEMSLHCSDDASSMLLLDTTPSVMIVAYKSGIIYHCVYLKDNSEGDEVSVEPFA